MPTNGKDFSVNIRCARAFAVDVAIGATLGRNKGLWVASGPYADRDKKCAAAEQEDVVFHESYSASCGR